MIFSVKLADHIFTVSTLYPDTFNLCKDYLTDQPGHEITITQDDIERERVYSIREAFLEGYAPPNYSDGTLETTAVYRKMANYFSYLDSAVVHGALLAYQGQGYLFTAPSGTGKTTHIQNWLKCFPQATVINGDKPVLRLTGGIPNGGTQTRRALTGDTLTGDIPIGGTLTGDTPTGSTLTGGSLTGGTLIGYGTPWCGKEGVNTNASVPIKAIISLHRAEENTITKVPLKKILSRIMAAVYRPQDAEGMKRTLQFVMKMNGKTSFYELGCNMDEASALVAYEGMKECESRKV